MSLRPRSPSNTEPSGPRSRRGGVLALAAVALAATLAGGTGPVRGASHVWAIAGEPDHQVEHFRGNATAVWVADALRGSTGGPAPMTLLADPTPERVDLRTTPRTADSQTALHPLARVFGQQQFNAVQARRQRIGATLAGARADTLSALLDKSFAAMAPGDRGVFFYTGPGRQGGGDTARTTLRLADNTALSIGDLDTLARQAPTGAPMRFVLTQCHASGFQRLIRPGGRDQRGLVPHNRCVFTAEPLDHLTRQCPSLDPLADAEGHDRDYATLFFSALGGRARGDMALRRSTDLDGDRIVTMHEAHLYALIESDSSELPRASTEAYLERWQPIWLRYVDTVSEPDNLYGRVAMALAERLRLPLRGRALIDALETRQTELMGRLERLEEESQRVAADIGRLQATLRRALTQRWPAVAHPHTAAYARFLVHDAGAAQNFLLGQTATYPVLVARQERQVRIAQDRQAIDRSLTQLDKLLRMRHLARLQAQFERHASAQARRDFSRLEHCEQTPF